MENVTAGVFYGSAGLCFDLTHVSPAPQHTQDAPPRAHSGASMKKKRPAGAVVAKPQSELEEGSRDGSDIQIKEEPHSLAISGEQSGDGPGQQARVKEECVSDSQTDNEATRAAVKEERESGVKAERGAEEAREDSTGRRQECVTWEQRRSFVVVRHARTHSWNLPTAFSPSRAGNRYARAIGLRWCFRKLQGVYLLIIEPVSDDGVNKEKNT